MAGESNLEWLLSDFANRKSELNSDLYDLSEKALSEKYRKEFAVYKNKWRRQLPRNSAVHMGFRGFLEKIGLMPFGPHFLQIERSGKMRWRRHNKS